MTGPIFSLSELCTINQINDTLSRNEYRNGSIPVIGNAKSPKGYHNISNTPEYTIIVSRTGNYGNISRYDSPIYLINEAYFIDEISNNISDDFLYYFLKYVASDKLSRRTGGPKSLTIAKLSGIKVYVPNSKLQSKFIEACEHFSEKSSSELFDAKVVKVIDKMRACLNSDFHQIETSWVNYIASKLFLGIAIVFFVFLFWSHQDQYPESLFEAKNWLNKIESNISVYLRSLVSDTTNSGICDAIIFET